MKRILVTYATNAGSTAEVAQVVGEELSKDGIHVEVKALEAVTALTSYDAVVVGGPMILGWHREARAFLKEYQEALQRVPVAYFMVALSLTEYAGEEYSGTRIYQDARLAKTPGDPDGLVFKERITSVPNYAQPALESAPEVTPVSIGFFGGALDYARLNLFQRLFVRLAIGAEEGDFRNWHAIHEWATELSATLMDRARPL
jgi:menaquinone-dependent protoporphyrinogen oxidase